MKFEAKNNILVIGIENTKSPNGWQYSRVDIPTTISQHRFHELIIAYVDLCSGLTINTQVNFFQTILTPLLKFISAKKIDLPDKINDSEWTLFLVNFFIFYLTSTDWSNRSLDTRMRGWRNIKSFLNLLKERKVIPLHTPVPKLVDKKQQLAFENTKQYVVGEIESIELCKSSLVEKDLENNKASNKFVLDLSYSNCTEAFLDNIELDLRFRIDGIQDICARHWDSMKAVHKRGQELIDYIGVDRINHSLKAKDYKFKHIETAYKKRIYLTNPNHKDGPAWSLAFLNYILQSTNKLNAISSDSIAKSPFFAVSCTLLANIAKHLNNSENVPEYYAINVLHRHLGILHVTDCAAACVLLTIEHPQITSESIQECKLLSVNNNHYLLTTDNGTNQIFSVDKPRAKTRKRMVLTPRAKDIVNYIIKSTEPIRNIMRRNTDANWRYLFLVSSNGLLRASSNRSITTAINNQNGLSLYRLYGDSFEKIGVSFNSLTLSRVRNTMGIIEWLKTGLMCDASRKLGNSERVCREHYIPPLLLRKWNERLIRRFQQTLILLASPNEPYLLEGSDFSSISDLVAFITQLVITNKKCSDPISDKIYERFAPQASELEGEANIDSELGINISPGSLCALYAFSDWAKAALSADELTYKDVLTGISPVTLIHLSTMLHHIVAAQTNDSADSAIKSKIQGDSAVNLQKTHEKALVLLPDYKVRFQTFSICKSRIAV